MVDWIEQSGLPELVSVVVPVHNRDSLILETLESVAAQTYRPIELVVVDDGSSDDTLGVVEKWADKVRDTDFDVKIIHQENGGAPSARNRGTCESTGEFIQYLDSDDALAPEKIALQVEALREVDLAYGNTYELGTDKKPSHYQNREMSSAESLLCSIRGECGVFCTCTPLFRRRLVSEVGPWDEKMTCLQDVDYGGRTFARSPEMQYVPASKCYVRAADERRQISAAFDGQKPRSSYIRSRSRLLAKLWRIVPSELQNHDEFRDAFANASLAMLCLDPEEEQRDALLEVLAATGAGTTAKRPAAMMSALTKVFGKSRGSSIGKGLLNLYRRLR